MKGMVAGAVGLALILLGSVAGMAGKQTPALWLAGTGVMLCVLSLLLDGADAAEGWEE